MSRHIVPASEAGFQSAVIAMAKRLGWKVAHFRKARVGQKWMTPVAADGAGWPDLVMARRGVILVAELKFGRNKTTPEQDAWIADLRTAGLDVRVWYPEDWPEIEETLRGQSP